MQTDALPLADIAARLGLRWTCPISRSAGDPDQTPLPDAHADRARGPLVVTLAETAGRWRGEPSRAVLVVTHHASGLALDPAAGPWHADTTGLRRAREAAKVLLELPGWRWVEVDPMPLGTDLSTVAATIRAALGDLAEAGKPARPKAARK